MPKKLTRHRRANKRGGQVAEAPAPAPMPTYVAPAPTYPPAPTEEAGVLGNVTTGVTTQFNRAKEWAANLWSSTGGRRRSRAMRGGNVNASDPLSLATNASPISGISSARAHNWVGGRTRAQKRSRSQGRSRSRAQSRTRKYRRARH